MRGWRLRRQEAVKVPAVRCERGTRLSGVFASFAINATNLLIAALGVGGSFMVITMAGIKEALHLGGGSAAQTAGLMTAGLALAK